MTTRSLVILTGNVIALQCVQSIVILIAFIMIIQDSEVLLYAAVGTLGAAVVANIVFVASVIAVYSTTKIVHKKKIQIVPVADVAVLQPTPPPTPPPIPPPIPA